MKPILIIQNITREQAGLITTVCQERQQPYVVLDLSKGQTLTGAMTDYAGVVMMGGPDSANDTTPKMLAALAFTQQALQQGLPFFGICLGLQVLTKAAGGQVVKCPVKEVGWNYTIQQTPAGQHDPLLKGLPDTIPVFQLHGEMVVPTATMTILAAGQDCPVQILQVANQAYGLQCHLELTDELYQIWLDQDPDLQQLNRFDLEQHWQTVRGEYTQQGKQLINNWLDLFSS
jgi:GMP synthase-like glutamine amidotransferase